MIKNWKEFIKEEFIENSTNIIDVKMEELNDLIVSLADDNNLIYHWENKSNDELIINFIANDLSVRYEFNIKNLVITKVVGENVDFTEDVESIDEALDIIEKDIHYILGVTENKYNRI